MKTSDVSDWLALTLVKEAWSDLERELGSPGAIQRFMALGIPKKVAISKLEKLVKRKLIEVGVSINRPWLTQEGRDLLETIQPENPEVAYLLQALEGVESEVDQTRFEMGL